MDKALFTTHGPIPRERLGMILPHEHIFVDFRRPDEPGHAEAETADVLAKMVPEVGKLRQLGISAMVDCTPVGVGRRADLVLAVAEAAGLPLVAPTGIYREPWVPNWAAEADEAALEDWMVRELTERFDEAPFRAGWIKLSVGDDGITPLEARIVRAAARASARTGAVIGSHTIRGRVVMDQLDIIEAAGGSAARYIAIHSQLEEDFGLNLALAERGAFIEYDNISWVEDAVIVARVLAMIEAGHAGRLLLSHDNGWYDPMKPADPPRPYTQLSETFLPALRAAGVEEATITRITHDNPFDAFARPL